MKIKITRILKSKLSIPVLLFLVTSITSAIILFIAERSTNKNIFTLFDTIWWSIVTMSTTGYGDIVPVSIFGRIITLIAIMLGILATSLLTGTIASMYLNQISRSRSGLMSYNKIRGHVVICGWRESMTEFLLQIIIKEKHDVSKIVIVTDANQELIDGVLSVKELRDVKFVRGNFYDKNILMKANIRHAIKAIVLADQTSARTIFEVDSRTVMSVISLKALNRHVHVSAQLLERNFEIYLQRAKCDEIIFSKEINTELLAMIVNQNGMSNVISAILGYSEEHCTLRMEPIRASFIYKSFSELEVHIREQYPRTTILGILENTGKQHEIMDKIVRKAQQTANFPEMLENLKQAKSIKPYRPILVPDPNYIIPQYSSVILLEKHHE